MAPPRLQCLNGAKQIAKNSSSLRASFSTAQKLALGPQRTSSSELLDTISGISSPPSKRTPNGPFNDGISNLLKQAHDQRNRRDAVQKLNYPPELVDNKLGQDLTRQISRRWREGDIYAPHDLSEVEMAKWKKRTRPDFDVFDVLNFKPLDHYKNFSIMGEYMTPMGRIKHSSETGLRPVNQRKIAKAIRRAIGIGLMPSVHRHPEGLYLEAQRSGEQTSAIRKDLFVL